MRRLHEARGAARSARHRHTARASSGGACPRPRPDSSGANCSLWHAAACDPSQPNGWDSSNGSCRCAACAASIASARSRPSSSSPRCRLWRSAARGEAARGQVQLARRRGAGGVFALRFDSPHLAIAYSLSISCTLARTSHVYSRTGKISLYLWGLPGIARARTSTEVPTER